MKHPISLTFILSICLFFLGYFYIKHGYQKELTLHRTTHITIQSGLQNAITAEIQRETTNYLQLFLIQTNFIEHIKDIAASKKIDTPAIEAQSQKILRLIYSLLYPTGLRAIYLYDDQQRPVLNVGEDALIFHNQSIAQRPEMIKTKFGQKPVAAFDISENNINFLQILPIVIDDNYLGSAVFVFSYDDVLNKIAGITKNAIGYTDIVCEVIVKKDLISSQPSKTPPKTFIESDAIKDWLIKFPSLKPLEHHNITLHELLQSPVTTDYREELQDNLKTNKAFNMYIPFYDGIASLIFMPALGSDDILQAYTVVLIPKDLEYMKLQQEYRMNLLFLITIVLFFSILVYFLITFYQKQHNTINFLSTLVTDMPDGLLVIDRNWNIKEVNEVACSILAYSKEELIGQNPHYLLHYHKDCAMPFEDCPIYKSITETGRYNGETLFKTKNGDIITVHIASAGLAGTEKGLGDTVMIFQDISEQKAAQQELLDSSRFYSMLMDISTKFLTTDHKGMDEAITYAIGQIALFFGADRCYLCHFSEDYEFMTSTYSWHRDKLASVGVSCLEAIKKCNWFIDKLFRHQTVYISNIDELPPTAYCERDSMIKGQINALVLIPVLDNAITTGCYVLEYKTSQNFTETLVNRMVFATDIVTNALYKFRFEKQMVQLATTDGLTTLANRRHFLELAEKEIKLSKRYHTPLSLIMFDIDHFKRINDSFGHAIGDEVLKSLSVHIKQTIRETDFAGRIGGEEFAIICHVEPQNAYLLAERLRKTVEAAPVICGETRIYITISLGIAGLDDKASNLTDLLKCADDALYQAKNAGRNQTKIWGAMVSQT